MKTLSIALASLVLSANAFAHTTFIGTVKGTGVPCSLEIEQTYFENNIETPANFRAEIAVSLVDGDDHGHGEGNHDDHFDFTISPSGKPNMFSGVAANKTDLINILVAPGTPGLSAPTAFSMKWLHGNHYHTAQCLNLKLAAHE